MATNREWLSIADLSDKDVVCTTGQIRFRTTAAIYDQRPGAGGAAGPAPVTAPSNPADDAVVIELYDDLVRYWTYDEGTASWTNTADFNQTFTISDGSNTFTIEPTDTLTYTSGDDTIEVDASTADTVELNVKQYVAELLHTGAATVVSSGVSEDFFTVPALLNGWQLDAVTYAQEGGVGDQDARLTVEGSAIGVAQSLSGDSHASESGIGETVKTGDKVRLSTVVSSGSPEGLAATFVFVKP